jgi:hypothetical protein
MSSRIGTSTSSKVLGIGSGASQESLRSNAIAGWDSWLKEVCQVIATLAGYCICCASNQERTLVLFLSQFFCIDQNLILGNDVRSCLL